MFVTKTKSMLAVVLVVGLALGGIGAGVVLLTNPVAVAQEETPDKAPANDDKSPDSDALKRAERVRGQQDQVASRPLTAVRYRSTGR